MTRKKRDDSQQEEPQQETTNLPDNEEAQAEGQREAVELQEGAHADEDAGKRARDDQTLATGEPVPDERNAELISQEIQEGQRSPDDTSDATLVNQDDEAKPVSEDVTFNERHDLADKLTTATGQPLGSIRSTPDGVYLSTDAARALLERL